MTPHSFGENFYRQTGMHAAARRQPDLELPTAAAMYVIAVNTNHSDKSWAHLVRWMEERVSPAIGRWTSLSAAGALR